MDVLVPGDIEGAVRTYVAAELLTRSQAARVYEAIPEDPPEEFVVIKRVGGSRISLVKESARMEVGCFAPTSERARALASLVYGLIFALKRRSVALSDLTVYDVNEFGCLDHRPHSVSLPHRYRFYPEIDYRLSPE